MPLTRDHFQNPVLDKDDSYLGKSWASKKLPYKNPTHLAQQQEPWCRLSSTPTITSMKRDVCLFYSEIPKDDLDFRLAALYNHHTGTFKNKSEILTHQETIQDTHRIKTQFCGEFLPPPELSPITSRANIRHWINPKKESIHSIQGSIVSPHTAATNGGYSRKNDGGFFSTDMYVKGEDKSEFCEVIICDSPICTWNKQIGGKYPLYVSEPQEISRYVAG